MAKKHKCRVCKKEYEKRSSMQIVCSPKCSIEYVNKQNEKKAKNEAKAARKAKMEFNKNDLSWQRNRTQASFNRMRVLQEKLWFQERGLRPTCISCGKENMDWCCGHYKTRGSYPELALDEKNTFLQCNYYCNKNLSGNIEGNKHTRGYKRGLKERFGDVIGQSIIDYLESKHPPKKYTADDYDRMRAQFNAEIRRLSKLVNE